MTCCHVEMYVFLRRTRLLGLLFDYPFSLNFNFNFNFMLTGEFGEKCSSGF